MISQEQIDQIEKYLQGEMSDQEAENFLRETTANQELEAEMKRREAAHTALDFLVADNLRAELKKWESESQKTTKVVSLSKRRRLQPLAIAASLAILVAAFFFIPRPSNELQFASYYEAPNVSLRGGQDDALPESLRLGLESIQANDLVQALDHLQADVATDYQIMANYYRAHVLYQMDRFSESQTYFGLVAAGEDIRYTQEAQWYELLSCLQAEGECQGLVTDLENQPNHPYYQQVTEIAKAIK